MKGHSTDCSHLAATDVRRCSGAVVLDAAAVVEEVEASCERECS